ncbi:alkylbase DNA glycosidase-like protein mag2 [Primulina tabacum]|uniref:alkylbase DNA glycosidase-like protein mag2 n=1 Tax=Primulina tabacum TaxID=48773 RepID=UPI003F5A5F73
MGEKTQTPIETPPKQEAQFQIDAAQAPATHASAIQRTDYVSVSPPRAPAVADTEIAHSTLNPSKIPIRPQKIRKLSIPTLTSGENPPPPPVQTGVSDESSSAAPSAIIASSATPTTPTTSRNRRRGASRALPQVIKPLSAEGEVELALHHLRAADPLLVPIIETLPPPQFESHHPPFLALAKSILYQQLAYKAGTSIYTRFVSLCGGEDFVCPDSVLALSSQQLKQIGVSGRKASYLHDLANKYKSGILSDETVVKMDDRSLFTLLSMVKGIGSWSVHMFMIFSLHRPDVLPVSDLGVRKGVQLLHGLEELPRPSQMEQLCEKWRPYRSVGAWYMWRVVEGKGAPSLGSAVALEDNVMQPLQQIEASQDGQQHLHQLQFVESVGNLGACIWNH